MSRSIHETRRMVRDTRREDWRNPEEREKRLAELNEKLELKRRVKRQLASERQARRMVEAEEAAFALTDPTAIPIRIEDQGACIHYPATPDDLHAVMSRLPKGVCDGLSEIVLSLGAHDPKSEKEIFFDSQEDPFLGRTSQEVLPGVWARCLFGHNLEETASIRLHAFIYSPDLEGRWVKEYLCRLRFLSSFVHLIAYHHGYTRRMARGRWLKEDEEKTSAYARELEHAWLHQAIVPYLEQAYPTETGRFIDWVEYQGGVRLTLDQMAGDPRKCIGDIQQDLFSLVHWVEEDKVDTWYAFADSLHMSEFYEEALAIVERMLSENPLNRWALRLKAHIWIDQDKNAEGRELALKIIEKNPDYANAWRELWYASEGLELWDEVIAAATREFELRGSDLKLDYGILQPRIRARLALGDFAGAEADIQLLEQSPSMFAQKRAGDYRLRLNQALADHSGR